VYLRKWQDLFDEEQIFSFELHWVVLGAWVWDYICVGFGVVGIEKYQTKY
jgi:hypothetical protein